MSTSTRKDTAELVRLVRKAARKTGNGITVERGGKHLRVLLHGKFLYSIPSTPSCPRSVANTTADLKRLGVL